MRQGKAVWIKENVLLQLLPEGSLIISREIPITYPSPYVPKSMPPVEVSGLHFDDPVKTLQSIRRFHVIVANGIGGGQCEA